MNAPVPSVDRVADAVQRRSRVLEALARHRDGYVHKYGGDPEHNRVLGRLLACRTGALGVHVCLCEQCGWSGVANNACRDRHCPQCQAREAAKWAEACEARMLDVPHFQVVFTLPAELRPLAFANQRIVYDLLFRAGASVLQDLGMQRLGGRMGITGVLHTWTRELTYHPHVHYMVTAGALAADDSAWTPSSRSFLFPQRVMGAMFRGRVLEKLIAALDADELLLPTAMSEREVRALFRRLARRHARWVVHVEPPDGRPVAHITRYLARYVKRVAISDARIVEVTDTTVSFRGRDGVVVLDGPEFVRRFLLHILPHGLRKVRHYGLYAPANIAGRLELARGLVDGGGSIGEDELEEEEEEGALPPGELCPSCGGHGVRRCHRAEQIQVVLARLRATRATARGPP